MHDWEAIRDALCRLENGARILASRCVIVTDSTGPDFARLVKKHNGRRRQL